MTADATPRPIVPMAYGGQWIAWNHTKTAIVASGRTLEEALEAAHKTGEADPILAKVPRSNMRFLGGVR